jgi:cysteine synthase
MSHVWAARDYISKNPDNTFFVNQHGNELNWKTHYEQTAQEILKHVQRVDVFVTGVGTGGALVGIGRRLKEQNPQCRIVQVEPEGFRTRIEGLLRITDNPRLPEVYNGSLVDESLVVPDEDAIEFTHYLNRTEGLCCGFSSGAVAWAARRYLSCNPISGTVVCMFADRIEKYLSTQAFDFPNAEGA